MSYDNKGSLMATATVTLEPDRSGNFVCDGTADDVQIQAAIDYVGSLGGGTVELGYGTYDINAQITDGGYNKIWLKGQGKDGATKLDLTSDIQPIYLNSVSGWKLSDFELDCNDQGTGGDEGVRLLDCSDCIIENLYVHNVNSQSTGNGMGIHIVSGLRCDVIRCKVVDCDHSGIIITASESGNSYYCNIIECYGEDNADEGAAAQSSHFTIYGHDATHRCYSCHIINCTGIDSGNHGVQIYQYADHCSVKGGYYSDAQTDLVCLGHGSYVDTCTYISAIDVKCVAATDGNNCVHIWNSGTRVEGCELEGLIATTNGKNGVSFGDVEDCRVIGCKITAPTDGRGMTIDADSHNNIIMNNEISGVSSGWGIRCYGDGNLIHDNLIQDCYIGIAIENGAIQSDIQDNKITGANTCINVVAGAVDTMITDNRVDGTTNIADAGTTTHAWLNWDIGGAAWATAINAPTVVGGGGGTLP